jgi:AraC family transcriptional regulator of adaptative response/methylated-DNA-[protein]-cysteine methyltransferase
MQTIAFTARQDEFWSAVLRRDTSFEGIFVLAVKTTGVFCRPGCPARFPLRSNVEFFPDRSAALHAGYRACRRCKPLHTPGATLPLVERLKSMIDAEPATRVTGAMLEAQGIDPSTARRQFQRAFGMSFAAYQRARRMGTALAAMRNGFNVLKTQLEHGFESPSGFRDAFTQLFGTPPSRSAAVRCLIARWIESPLGPMLALADDSGLYVLDWVNRRGLEREIGRLRKQTGAAIVPGDHALLTQTERELGDYFAGRRHTFTIPLAQRGSGFQNRVWNALIDIPFGTTTSYAALANSLGRASAVRAVARANGDNYRSILVPCHRVIGSDGQLTGYGGGLARKQWLLDHERDGAKTPSSASRQRGNF